MLEHVLTASMNADSAQRLAATEEQRYQSDAKESRGGMRRLADAACGQDSAFAEEIRRRRNEIEKLYDPDNLSLKEVQVHQEVIGTKLRQVGFVFEPAFRLGFNVIIFIEVRVTTNASKQHNGKLAADLIVVLEKTVDGCKGKLEVKKTTATAKPESFHKPTSTFNQLLDRIDRSKGRVASAFIVESKIGVNKLTQEPQLAKYEQGCRKLPGTDKLPILGMMAINIGEPPRSFAQRSRTVFSRVWIRQRAPPRRCSSSDGGSGSLGGHGTGGSGGVGGSCGGAGGVKSAVAGTSTGPGDPPVKMTLKEKADILRTQLELSGTTHEVITQAAKDLGVDTGGERSLVGIAADCMQKLGQPQ